jgi:hypothetical protein
VYWQVNPFDPVVMVSVVMVPGADKMTAVPAKVGVVEGAVAIVPTVIFPRAAGLLFRVKVVPPKA